MERVFSAVFNTSDPGVRILPGSRNSLSPFPSADDALVWMRERDWPRSRDVRRLFRQLRRQRAAQVAAAAKIWAEESGGADAASSLDHARTSSPTLVGPGRDRTYSDSSTESDDSDSPWSHVPDEGLVTKTLLPFRTEKAVCAWLDQNRDPLVALEARIEATERSNRAGATESETPKPKPPKGILRKPKYGKPASRTMAALDEMDYCPSHAAKRALRGFTYAYGLKATMALVFGAIRGKFRPKDVLKALTSYSAVRFGLFCAGMTGTHSLMRYLLYLVRGKDGRLNAMIAGGVSGFALLLDDPKERASIALYMLVRALFALGRTLRRYRYLPRYDNVSYSLFALCNGPLMYAACLEPHLLSRGYYHWMLQIASMSDDGLRLMRDPYHDSTLPFRKCGQPWHEGHCLTAHTTSLPKYFALSARMYLPVHAVPVLLFKWQKLMSTPGDIAKTVGLGVAKSSGFLAGYIFLLKATVCLLRNVRGKDAWWHSAAGGLMTFLPLQLESRARVSELMLYCAPHSIRVVWGKLKQEGFVRPLPHSDVIMFCAAMALILSTQRDEWKPTYASVLAFFFGREEPEALGKW